MEYQAQSWQVVLDEEAKTKAPRSQWRFTEIYEALLNSPDLIEPELVELGRLVAKRLAACQQRRRAAKTIQGAGLPGYRTVNLQ
jgi:hypothetical protein